MRFSSRLRASSALWAGPFALALPLFYYLYGQGAPPEDNYGYAPTIVSFPLAFSYPFAYAVASALSVLESKRLKRERVWDFSPYRNRYRVAAHAVSPVIGLSWLMLILPVTLALVSNRTMPDAISLLPLGLGLLLCVAHSVIGFAIGFWVPVSQVITAPIMAVAVWVLTAFSRSTEPFWLRHVSGYFGERLMFGEAASFEVLLPHLLLTGGIAAGVALMWLRPVSMLLRAVLAVTVAGGGSLAAHDMTSQWGPTPPLTIGHAPMQCSGNRPQVCMPAATADALPEVTQAVTSVLSELRAVGVTQTPNLITDSLADGRYQRSSSDQVWRVHLTRAAEDHSLRYRLGFAAAHFPCSQPDLATSRAVRLWVALSIGEGQAERARVAQEVEPFTGQAKVEKLVAKVRKMPSDEQGAWFRSQRTAACSKEG